MNKTTKREFFEIIRAAMTEIETLDSETVTPSDVIEFCENEIALLDKKSAKAKENAAKKKASADELLEVVYDALSADEFMTIADVTLTIGNEDITTSKVTYRLSALEKAGRAEKTQVEIPATETSKKRKATAYRKIV